jgi:hypothetical protein
LLFTNRITFKIISNQTDQPTGSAVQIREFEQAVWRTDRLRVFVRAPKEATVQDDDWIKAADQGMALTEYLKTRIAPRIGSYQSGIVDGSGEMPNGNMKIGNLRKSYGGQG